MYENDFEKKKKIEFYISKLQNLLTKVITESKEFQELKKIVGSDDSEIQFCIFSIMADKNTLDFLKNMDSDFIHKMLMEAHNSIEQDNSDSMDESMWTEDDIKFLKDIKIIF